MNTQTIVKPEIDLYPYNLETFNNILELWKASNKAAVIQATGTGKTYLILKCAYEFYGEKVIILAPSNYILEQIEKKANYNLPNVELMTYAKLSFMTIDEISLLNPSLIILDEFHRCGADQWGSGVNTLIEMYPEAKILGTTATPIRYLDKERNMSDELFEGNVAVDLNLAQAIIRKILPAPKYISALYTLDEEVSNLEDKIKNCHNTKEEKILLMEQVKEMKHNLDKSKGISNILRKHLKGIEGGKYILFCKDINHMNEMKDLVIDWFNAARLGKEVDSYFLYSGQSDNNVELSNFIYNEKNENVRLLFTINMLNEGLHIDGVNGVILLRPTTSPIIYFQQIGRAIQAGSKVNPLIFDFVNNFNSMGSKKFKEEIEKTEREEIERRENSGESKEDIIIDKFVIYDEVQDIMDVFGQIEEELYDNWNVMFEKYRNNEIDENMKKWIKTQRYFYSSGKISDDRRNSLESINFVWSQLDDNWDEMFNELKNGRCNTRIRSWISTQKQSYRSNSISKERVEKLESINFVWDKNNTDWNIFFNKLKNDDYDKENDKKMKNWITSQRTAFKGSKLSSERIKMLESINFIWCEFEYVWESNFNLLKEYITEEENVMTIFYKNKKLRTWIVNQRHYFKNSKLSQDRIDRLNSIGFVWNMKDVRKSNTQKNVS